MYTMTLYNCSVTSYTRRFILLCWDVMCTRKLYKMNVELSAISQAYKPAAYRLLPVCVQAYSGLFEELKLPGTRKIQKCEHLDDPRVLWFTERDQCRICRSIFKSAQNLCYFYYLFDQSRIRVSESTQVPSTWDKVWTAWSLVTVYL